MYGFWTVLWTNNMYVAPTLFCTLYMGVAWAVDGEKHRASIEEQMSSHVLLLTSMYLGIITAALATFKIARSLPTAIVDVRVVHNGHMDIAFALLLFAKVLLCILVYVIVMHERCASTMMVEPVSTRHCIALTPRAIAVVHAGICVAMVLIVCTLVIKCTYDRASRANMLHMVVYECGLLLITTCDLLVGAALPVNTSGGSRVLTRLLVTTLVLGCAYVTMYAMHIYIHDCHCKRINCADVNVSRRSLLWACCFATHLIMCMVFGNPFSSTTPPSLAYSQWNSLIVPMLSVAIVLWVTFCALGHVVSAGTSAVGRKKTNKQLMQGGRHAHRAPLDHFPMLSHNQCFDTPGACI